MVCVLVAVRAELFKFQASRRVATILLSGVATYAIRALIGIATALGALKRNYKTNAFSHDLFVILVNAVFDYAIERLKGSCFVRPAFAPRQIQLGLGHLGAHLPRVSCS